MADERECLLEGLRYNFGETIMAALEDPEVVEIMANPDGTLWIERLGGSPEYHGMLDPGKTLSILLLMASALNVEATVQTPIVEGELPLDNSRFEGTLPPIVSQASFTIRKKASQVFSLEQYVEAGVMPAHLMEIIKKAVASQLNILVVGGTGSGKTTLVNALILALSELCPDQRLIIMEDTLETGSGY